METGKFEIEVHNERILDIAKFIAHATEKKASYLSLLHESPAEAMILE